MMPKKSTVSKSSKPRKKASSVKTKDSTVAKKSPSSAKAKNVKVLSAKKAPEFDVKGILKQLEALGDAKMRQMHTKNGFQGNQYGVKMGDIRKVADKCKAGHQGALELWKTEILDAQLVATLLLKANQLSAKELESMVRTATLPQLSDWLHSYVVKEHPEKEALRIQWMQSKHPMEARAAWRLTAGRVVKSPEGLELEALLDRIEREMGSALPEVQWTMNMCLAEIGIHFAKLRKRAIAIGEKLGVFRDYPTSKGCTSPFAPIWIEAMVQRNSK